MTKKEKIIQELLNLGWERYFNDDFHFRCLNRYVDIDLPYIDIYVYADGEKYKGYLIAEEFSAFSELFKVLNKEGRA